MIPLSPILENGNINHPGAHIPSSPSACASFPSHRRGWRSQHSPCLGHSSGHFWCLSFPCLSIHYAQSLFPNIPANASLSHPQGHILNPCLLWGGFVGQTQPSPPGGGGGSATLLVGRGLFPKSLDPIPMSYQDVVLRNGDVAGVDGQPDALLHLGGEPAGLSGPLTALLPGAPGADREATGAQDAAPGPPRGCHGGQALRAAARRCPGLTF